MHPIEFWRFIWQKIREHENLPTLPRLRFGRLGWVGKLLCVLVPFWVFLLWDWYAPLQVSTRYSQVVLAQDSTILHAYLTPDQKWRLKTELNEISPALRKMLLHKESYRTCAGYAFQYLVLAKGVGSFYYHDASGAYA
jgi:membrane carboxypeptidase/penicillin-binding protein PbpC